MKRAATWLISSVAVNILQMCFGLHDAFQGPTQQCGDHERGTALSYHQLIRWLEPGGTAMCSPCSVGSLRPHSTRYPPFGTLFCSSFFVCIPNLSLHLDDGESTIRYYRMYVYTRVPHVVTRFMDPFAVLVIASFVSPLSFPRI